MNEPLWSAALQMRAQGKTVIFSFLAVLLAEIQSCSDLRVFQAKIMAQNKRMWVTTLLKEVSFRLKSLCKGLLQIVDDLTE